MLSIFGKEYSSPKGKLKHIYFACLFGIFIGSFLVIFEPFDLHDAPYPYKPYSVAFFGIFSTLGLILSFYLLPKTLPGIFSDQRWKVWHQILLLIFTLLVIATLNGIYINYIGNLDFSWNNYGWMISRTFAVASIPACIFVLLDYNQKLAKNLRMAESLRLSRQQGSDKPSSMGGRLRQIHLRDNNQKVSVLEADIVYMEAEGNYINLFTLKEDNISKQMIRTSLTTSEQALGASYILRCHRSYIVNLLKVIEVSGNAQGLRLNLGYPDHIIPVSRKYIPVINSYFESLDN